jgi:hypothetical protein
MEFPVRDLRGSLGNAPPFVKPCWILEFDRFTLHPEMSFRRPPREIFSSQNCLAGFPQ